MKRAFLIAALALSGLGLAACSPQAPAEPKPETELKGTPTNLKDLEAAHDWQHEGGAAVNKAWDEGVKAILGKMTRPDAIAAIKEAGFECIYGEAHETYPDPAAQCTRSFATRACQMDWEIFSTADKGKVDEVDGSFKRDCVGVADDWPDPIKSAIDDQLAPATPPEPPKPN